MVHDRIMYNFLKIFQLQSLLLFHIDSVCLLLRWGALDAEAYIESSRSVLKILWEVGSSSHLANNLLWLRARISAIEALTQYEVTFMNCWKACLLAAHQLS